VHFVGLFMSSRHHMFISDNNWVFWYFEVGFTEKLVPVFHAK